MQNEKRSDMKTMDMSRCITAQDTTDVLWRLHDYGTMKVQWQHASMKAATSDCRKQAHVGRIRCHGLGKLRVVVSVES